MISSLMKTKHASLHTVILQVCGEWLAAHLIKPKRVRLIEVSRGLIDDGSPTNLIA